MVSFVNVWAFTTAVILSIDIVSDKNDNDGIDDGDNAPIVTILVRNTTDFIS